MTTIQTEIEDEMLPMIDRAAEKLHQTRSEFLRLALRLALRRYEIIKLEQQHIEGYQRHPVEPGEFDVWFSELTCH
jgi:metal-responsive CopG/Arc/MetJ family transcriptional regulator